jgi:phosphate-selective porin OprO and OprP
MPWRRLLVIILCAAAWRFDAAHAAGPEDSPVWLNEYDETAAGETFADAPWAAEITALRERIDQLEASAKEVKAKSEVKPEVNWTGQLQADFYWFNQDEASKESVGDIQNGEAFRRARFGMWGHYGPSEYRIEVDFALQGRPSFLDVYAGLHDLPLLGRVRVGHFFEPFSLERLTPNRYVTFMERALPDQAFVPARNMGVMANNTWAEDDGTWGLGVFYTDSDVWGDSERDSPGCSLTGRITFLPWYDQNCPDARYFHMGASGSYRGSFNDQVRFRAQPEARLGSAVPNVPFFVDTGFFAAESFSLLGVETALVDGPFSLQAEYMHVPVESNQWGGLAFSGWYAQATYFLTGEHRPYLKEYGIFGRVKPLRDFVRYSSDGCVSRGPGAWEVAVRLSHLDLNDNEVRGGKLTDFTVGLNWYLSPYLRFTSNYIHAFLDDSNGVESGTDIFACRVGYEF